MHQEFQEMLRKVAIALTNPIQRQSLNSIFFVTKKDGGKRPVVNLKELNKSISIPYQYFQMKRLFLLKEMLQPG